MKNLLQYEEKFLCKSFFNMKQNCPWKIYFNMKKIVYEKITSIWSKFSMKNLLQYATKNYEKLRSI